MTDIEPRDYLIQIRGRGGSRKFYLASKRTYWIHQASNVIFPLIVIAVLLCSYLNIKPTFFFVLVPPAIIGSIAGSIYRRQNSTEITPEEAAAYKPPTPKSTDELP